MADVRKTRPISWIKAALNDFQNFPREAQNVLLAALTIAAEGGKADITKPMLGLGSGVFEIALRFRGDAFRVVYAVQIADECGCFMRSRRNRNTELRHQSPKSTWSRTV